MLINTDITSEAKRIESKMKSFANENLLYYLLT